MSNVSSVIERVQKLLALSKSDNANEAAAAAAAANRLIDAYRLSEADLDQELKMAITKKEKEILRSDKAQVEGFGRDSNGAYLDNLYIVKMCLTKGELLALKYQLQVPSYTVGEDLRAYLNNALERAQIDPEK